MRAVDGVAAAVSRARPASRRDRPAAGSRRCGPCAPRRAAPCGRRRRRRSDRCRASRHILTASRFSSGDHSKVTPSTQPIPAATASGVTLCAVEIFGSAPCVQQQLHQLDVAGLRGAQERRRAVFVQPLHGEDGARLGGVAGAVGRVDCTPQIRAFTLAPLSSSSLMKSR